MITTASPAANPAGGQFELHVAKGSLVAELRPRTLVQIRDIDAAAGDHHGVAISRAQPVAHKPLPDRRLGRLDHQRSVLHVQRHRRICLTGAQPIERLSLPRVDLSDGVAELDRQPTTHEPGERPAGLDLGQLPMVADQHELSAGELDATKQLHELARREHPSLVDNEHGTSGKPITASEVLQQRRHARARDPGALGELIRRTPSDRHTEHRMAGGLPCLPSRAQGERLASPGLPSHHRDTIAGKAQRLDYPLLLTRERRPTSHHGVDDALSREPYTCSLGADRTFDEIPLKLKMLGVEYRSP